MFGVIFNSAMAALNVALFVHEPNPWSAGAAVFCLLMAFFCALVSA